MKKVDEKTLRARIEAYFTACDDTKERITLKSGNICCRQTPYTLAGLAESLGVPQGEIRAAAETGRGGRAKAYGDALRRIERYTVERALLGELQYSVAAMLLRGLGSGEGAQLPPEEDDKSIVITLEDKEGWSE